jgi:hypothetical protein
VDAGSRKENALNQKPRAFSAKVWAVLRSENAQAIESEPFLSDQVEPT